MIFKTNPNAGTLTERMRIDSAGNLSLGGFAPSAWSTGKAIEVGNVGNAFWGVSATQISITQNAFFDGAWKYAANGYATRFQEDSGAYIWNTSPNNTSGAGAGITFTAAMTLDASGNLFVGHTSDISNGGFALNPLTSGGGNSYQTIGHKSGTASGDYYIGFYYAGSAIGSITQSGTTAVLYNTTSDQRLKTNVVNAPSGNIDGIKVRSFDWIADGSHQEYGMVAQELVTVAPYAVHQPTNPDEMMGVDYSKLVPMMIKEIQDLKQRIATLENK